MSNTDTNLTSLVTRASRPCDWDSNVQSRKHGRDARATGFTLVEMITVLTIIILVLAIAIPVWSALMGGTNLAAAQNQIAAFIGNARADAIYNRQSIGVLFYIDPKTRQTAMAEVQTQPFWNPTTLSYSSLFTPNVFGIPAGQNGQANAIEMVNTLDPTSTPTPPAAPNRTYYRDIVLLPTGVGVALNNNTYTYNLAASGGSNYFAYLGATNTLPRLDRYLRLGIIMFAGTLTSIPFAIPYHNIFTPANAVPGAAPNNLVCERLGMVYLGTAYDIASNVDNTSATPPAQIPLMTSVGLVIFDHDAYLSQHATLKVGQGSNAAINVGDGAQFNDLDMNYTLYTNITNPGIASVQTNPDDKFVEENWIDQNGIAMMVSPFNGSLIKAK